MKDESKFRYFVAPWKNKTEIKSKKSSWLLEVQHSQGLKCEYWSLSNALCVQMCEYMLLLVKLY